MNLHRLAAGMVSSINPMIPVTIRISTGPSAPNAAGKRTPTFATPAAFTGSISGRTLTVTAISAGALAPGQTVAGTGVASGTEILAFGTATGGAGTYVVSRDQTVGSVAMTSALVMGAQMQSLTNRDLQMLDGLNLGGELNKVYLYGSVNAVLRLNGKGGDLIDVPAGGVHAGTWLITKILEQFPDWVCAAITLQADGT